MATQRLCLIGLASVAVTLAALCGPRLASAQSAQFYPITPCRVVDTRFDIKPGTQPPSAQPLVFNETRSFAVKGPVPCNVPSDAKAIAYNLTAAQVTSVGHFRIFPAGEGLPTASAINFVPGAPIANGGVVKISPGTPDLSIYLFFGSGSGTAHAILDVTGYFK